VATFHLLVNGKSRTVDADPEVPLLWALRDHLGLTGTKVGCEKGLCGSCTVHLDGQAARSCRVRLGDLAGQRVTTIEGLAAGGLHPVQQAWLDEQVSQCGYCQPGQIMAVVALLSANPDPSDADIDEAMADSLCRCGTYPRIRRAIHRAAREGAAKQGVRGGGKP
jgi:aerobic-type carbon monoxide dehydrogenase small subunit (CoxS/CutS family)